jgi:hypothetical protein
VEWLVARVEGFEDEFFEKPGGMSKVPFRRGNIFHGLNHVIFNFEGFANSFRMLPGFQKRLQKGICTDHSKLFCLKIQRFGSRLLSQYFEILLRTLINSGC